MKEQVIKLAKQAGLCWSNDEKPLIERFAALVRNAALEEAKQLFSQPHQEYFGREAQDAIESLKEPTP